MNNLENIKQAIFLQKELDKLRPLSDEQNQKVLQKFRLDWNYHSNNIEGNSLTYGETKLLLLHGLTAQGKPLKDHLEIKGHNEAMDWIFDIVKKNEPITEYFIRSLNEMLLGSEPIYKDAINKEGQQIQRIIQGGKYKTQPNHVLTKTGETFYFASPEETPSKMHDLMQWYEIEKAKTERNPIILAAEFHYKFIRIHPFDDGNGRTARLLMNLILMRFDFPPAIIKTNDKENYYTVLRQADGDNIIPFIDYIAQNIIHSLEIMISAAKGEDISDPNDLDKEIALLEQQLKTAMSKELPKKSAKILSSLYENSIQKIINQFIDTSVKFDRLYSNKTYRFFINDTENQNQFIVSKNIYRYKIEYNHNSLKYEELEQVNNSSSISIDFKNEFYVVQNSNQSTLIKKNYNQQLTDQEIKSVVEAETNLHKELIAQKIKEYQEKK
jgi:Fic family protein